MTIAELNRLDQARFVEAIGWVCVHSTRVPGRAWNARPLQRLEHLHVVNEARELDHPRSAVVLSESEELVKRAPNDHR